MKMEAGRGSLESGRVLVTGAGQGIGQAIASAVGAAGATVIVADLKLDHARATAEAIVAAGGRATAHLLDVRDAVGCRSLAAETLATHGALTGLVNNAGVLYREKFEDEDFLAKWRATFAVNAEGVVNVVSAYLDQIKSTSGSIVNILSTAGLAAGQGSPAYAASKGAATQLTKVLARDLAPFGVRVNGVAPGMVVTPLTEASRNDPVRMEKQRGRLMLKRLGEPNEVAGPVVMLLSSAASYMTGAVVVVDGGATA